MKTSLPQRENFTIYVIFQALSIESLRNSEKDVQQGQKREIWAKIAFLTYIGKVLDMKGDLPQCENFTI